MSTYLVTGGAGFIGSHLTEELVRRGEKVRVADSLITGKRSNLDHVPEVEFFQGDLADLDFARKVVEGCDYVLHQAAIPSVPRSVNDPITSNRANVDATLNVLVAARDVEWLQASGNYVNMRVRGHDYPLRTTMAGIEERLDPGRFARIHRSYMVNLGQVASIEPLDTGDARVHLVDGTVLPCSRRHREALRERAGFA